MSCGCNGSVPSGAMMIEEKYDPSKPVCDNQDDFNQAVRKALKNNYKEEMKKVRPWIFVYMVLWLIFFVWAVLLAMQIPAGPERVEHLVFAMVFSPIYVLAYYLGALGNGDKSSVVMGMCGCNSDKY